MNRGIPPSPPARQPRRAAGAAFVGTMIEWYDFYIYANAAALVFGELFFPSRDPFTSTMASFATFAVGFFARPLGGLFFGHLGDRIGRKKALMTTLALMGAATVCVGLLPTYERVGLLAPVLLVLLRIVQGIAVGGEWGGAVLMAGEHAPHGRRTFFASFAQLGSPAGLILSLVAFRAVASMERDAFMAWGWRLPFLASIALLAVGVFVRLKVDESPEFAHEKAMARTVARPIAEVLRTSRAMLLFCLCANTIGIAGLYFTNTFMIAFTTQHVGVTKSLILDCLFIVAIIQFVTQPIAAWLGGKLGDARFLKLAALFAMASPYPMFALVQTGRLAPMVIGISIATVFLAGFYSVIAGFVSGAFPTRVRYSAISISYQMCGAIAGGLTPLAGTWLAHRFVGQWWPLAVFYTCLAALSLAGVIALDARRHRRADVADAVLTR
ncbi:MFS transporter [Burkholderia thailandensis]|uniref:Sugar transporter family protein n=2 Tax=Burkholderia thailandensis TaxID=57975 RepID=A0AAW9CRY5_BURTH|nr:MFS transporter [Burkholderia thailandensis]ABC35128.1 major facilitator family transporter [Burkholderia thailandensis E264]AHI68302.1 sugar (and other) transporter family protein [Burkholderia thailandensis H0587]AHI76731.1 sugar (and other) transporter family protein [Burkholderia thailandensis 2002721723]AHI82435.1 sugar (and other) transporter family protein [Burkholderia thailandensis E444]AIC90312.1 sugar (and other) transporter family protein [Burkholderia thailandensis USAMRU Malay